MSIENLSTSEEPRNEIATPADRLTWLGSGRLTTMPNDRRWLLTDPFGANGERVGVLPLGKAGLLIGAGGVSKTAAIVELALAVATGTRWLGSYDVAEPGRVAALLGEEDADEVARRFYWTAKHLRLSDAQIAEAESRIMVAPLAGCVVTDALPSFGKRLAREDGEWRLVVLDPLARFAGLEAESSNAAATGFVASVERFASLPGNPTTLVVHHTNQSSRQGGWGGATAARGVTALIDGVRWVAALTENNESIEFAVVKSNYGPKAPQLPALDLRRGDHGILRPASDAEQGAAEQVSRAHAESLAAKFEARIREAIKSKGARLTSKEKLRQAVGGNRERVGDTIDAMRDRGELTIDAKEGARLAA